MRQGRQRGRGSAAERYGQRLRQQIADEARCRVRGAEPWMRLSRAAALWREATGHDPPTTWTTDDIVRALVHRAYPDPRLE